MNVAFEKYSSHGNHFVLVDETGGAQVADAHKPQFVRRCADTPGGVGADSVLFLASAPRRCSAALPSFAARFFEPNGDEFMTCGNGLASIAHHLHRCHGVDEAAVLVELPSRRPRWCRVGRDGGDWRVELRPSGGRMRRFAPTAVSAGGAALVLPLDVTLFAPVLRRAAGAALVYTGEPHCVVFDPEDVAPDTAPVDAAERESLLVERIGRHANRALREHFPFGINVDLAWRRDASDSLDYTCYERGIERETLACGTGALAVGLAARHLGLALGEVLRLLPRRARRHPRFAAAQLQVRFGARSLCTLTTRAEHVFTGVLTAECCA